MNKKICFIAQFPPPIHGLSKAVETLYNSTIKKKINVEKVDITNNRKILRDIIKIFMSKSEVFYFTISQTRWGNLRDVTILKLLELKRKKCIIHLHGGYYRKLVDNDMGKWQRNLNYKAISKLDGVIVLSNSLKYIFKDMIEDEKIYVVPNCVDNEYLMSNDAFEEKINLITTKEVLNVLYLSNFIKSKGYLEVLKLAMMEKDRVDLGCKKRLHFNFAGKFFDEEERQIFFNYIKEYDLYNFVSFYGIVKGKEKEELLNKSDVFVLLTKYPNEGQPISILEAMGNGMMIIATDHAGIPDIVQDNVNGILVKKESFDINSIFNEIRDMSNSEIKRYCLVNRFEILKKYNEEIYIDNCLQLILKS